MKKILFTFLFTLCCLTMNAQIQTYKATSYAYAEINQYTGRYNWSDWYKCDVSIVFDLQRDIITIYSKSTQYYSILTTGTASTDSSGGKQISFRVIDQDDDRGTLKLRIEKNGNSQLYVDFNNVAWCYNLVRTS